MAKKLFIGSLDWGVTTEDLQQAFSGFGEIEDCIVLTDKFTGKSRGFGFVTFVNDEDAEKAVAELDGSDLKGRQIVVNEARPPRDRDE